jgi:hypothetical protein
MSTGNGLDDRGSIPGSWREFYPYHRVEIVTGIDF